VDGLSLRHWFGLAQVSSVLLGAWTLWVTKTGLPEDMSNQEYWSLMGIGAALTLIAWYLAARQAKEAAASEARSRAVEESRDAMLARLMSTPGSGVENLTQIPHSAMRAQVRTLAQQMRAFEKEMGIHCGTKMLAKEQGESADEFGKRWDAEQDRARSVSKRMQGEFRERIIPQALAIRDELLKRNALPHNYKQPGHHRPLLLDPGMFAGPDPISESAEFLEHLARLLPE
jgi:hypothetical protein